VQATHGGVYGLLTRLHFFRRWQMALARHAVGKHLPGFNQHVLTPADQYVDGTEHHPL
jgi:hypothetical protein